MCYQSLSTIAVVFPTVRTWHLRWLGHSAPRSTNLNDELDRTRTCNNQLRKLMLIH